jgi:hypothetical protein
MVDRGQPCSYELPVDSSPSLCIRPAVARLEGSFKRRHRRRPPSIRNRPHFHERSNPPLSGRTVRRRIGSDRANPNTAGPNLLRPWGSKLEDGVRPLSTLSSSARTSLAGRRRHPDAARAATSQIRLHTAIARSASAEPIRCLQRPGRTVSDRSRPEGGAGYTPERNPASWLAG